MKLSHIFATLWILSAVAVGAEEEGKELYEAACASCHGLDGRGTPEGTALAVPLPDFTDCSFVTGESTGNWVALVAHGGPELGLSPQMPSFRDVLTEPQIREIIVYLRQFCADPAWPSADLNFRRPLFVGKAFPEDEVVLNVNFEKSRSSRSLVNEWILEKRLGPRGMVEAALPFVYRDPQKEAPTGGIGDLTLAYKRLLLADPWYGAVAAFSLDVGLPTGDRDRRLGNGTVEFGPSLRAGKTIGPLVLQSEIKAVLPIDVNRAPRRLLYRAVLQFPFSPLRRDWVPGVGFEADTKVEGEARDTYSLTPQIYKGLSRSGHIAVAVGAKIPIAGARTFDYQVGAFLLWEYMEGGLWW